MNGPSRQVSGLSSSSDAEQLPQLRPRRGRRIDLRGGGVLVTLGDDIGLDPPGVDDGLGGLDQVRRSNFAIRLTLQDLERIEPPRAGGHHPHQRDVVVRVRDRPQRLLQVADLRRREQRQPADDGVRDVLVAQPRHDRLAVLVLAIQDGDVRPAVRPGRRRASALMASTMATASSSGPAQIDELDGVPSSRSVTRRLSGSKRVSLFADQPVGGGQHVADGAEVLLDPQPRRRAGRRGVGVVRGRAARTARRTRRTRRSWRPGSGRSTGRRRPRP